MYPKLVNVYTAQCPPLYNPAFGSVEVSGHSVGDTATYYCGFGYKLIGETVLTCRDDSSWSNEPPTCISMHSNICQV